MNIRRFQILCFLIVLLFALGGRAEGNLPGTGTNYTVTAGQTLYGGLCAQGSTSDGCGIEVTADDFISLPRLYGESGGTAVRGIQAHTSAAELFVTPRDPSQPVTLDFLLIENGASVDLRLWECQGEIGFLNGGCPALVISQIHDEHDNVLTVITRTMPDGRMVNGECAVYRSVSGVVRLSGSGKYITAAPPADAVRIASAQWSYDTGSGKVSASALDANGKYAGISYYAFVDDIILMSGRNTAQATGTVKATSSDAQWRLRIVYPEEGIIHSPVYHINGAIAALSEGMSYQTQKEIESPAETASPIAQETVRPTPTVTPQPQPTFGGTLNALPIPDAEAPAQISADKTYFYASSDVPEIRVTVSNAQVHVEIISLPAGFRVERITLIQKRTGGIAGINMQNGYTADSWFALDNADSTVSITLSLTSSDGKSTRTVNCGIFSLKES